MYQTVMKAMPKKSPDSQEMKWRYSRTRVPSDTERYLCGRSFYELSLTIGPIARGDTPM